MRAVIKVMIVQPDIPAYRLPLFEELASHEHLRISVHASQDIVGGPPSAKISAPWIGGRPRCRHFFGGRLLWQSGMRLPADFSAGDVLVISGNPRILSNIPLIVSARRRGVGIVWWGHGWSATSVGWRAYLRRRLMRLADVMLLYADEEVHALKRVSVPHVVVTATNNTLDPRPMRQAQDLWPPQRLEEFKRNEGIVGKNLILFCGRLRREPSCDMDQVLRAMSLRNAGEQQYQLAVIGTGESEAGLRTLAEKLGLSSDVRWLGAIYDERELAPWFMSARCFVYPGSIGLSLIHAFCYGLPVITHDQVRLHNPEIHALRDGKNGRLFRKNDVAHLWKVIAEVCGNESLRDRLGEQARQTAFCEWSFDGMVKRFVAALEAASQRAQAVSS